MAKVYVAQFFGDIQEKELIVDVTLDVVLNRMMERESWGTVRDECKFCTCEDKCYNAPDCEDNKIEVWEFDTETKTGLIVWGFWGWHWQMPEHMEQGTLPGNEKSLYALAEG